MIWHYVNDTDFWCVGTNGRGSVLVQLGDSKDMLRIRLTPADALAMSRDLAAAAVPHPTAPDHD